MSTKVTWVIGSGSVPCQLWKQMKVLLFTATLVICLAGKAQIAPDNKQILQHTQSWYALNSTFRLSDRWGIVADFHMRRDGLMDNEYFYFVRLGGVYWIQKKYPVVAGVARMWVAGSDTWAVENRVYQQWSSLTEEGRLSILQRIRLEQRWRDQVTSGQVVGDKQFSLRTRYLASFQINVFKDSSKPAVVVSDEVLVQFGPTVVYNTFDQNRLFLGVRLNLGKHLSMDTGYMNVFQQRAAGDVYDVSHVFRVFLYWNLDLAGVGKDHRLHENTE